MPQQLHRHTHTQLRCITVFGRQRRLILQATERCLPMYVTSLSCRYFRNHTHSFSYRYVVRGTCEKCTKLQNGRVLQCRLRGYNWKRTLYLGWIIAIRRIGVPPMFNHGRSTSKAKCTNSLHSTSSLGRNRGWGLPWKLGTKAREIPNSMYTSSPHVESS